jgi:hypothetical protein
MPASIKSASVNRSPATDIAKKPSQTISDEKAQTALPQTGLDLRASESAIARNPSMKRIRQQLIRILALDLHPRSVGYAVIENTELLYWGAQRWKSSDSAEMTLGISRLIGTWQPSQIVIREGAPLHRMVSMRKIVRKARIPVVTIRRRWSEGLSNLHASTDSSEPQRLHRHMDSC